MEDRPTPPHTLDAGRESGDAVEAKPRAAASLTADIVARGRNRKQEYGEAGLWRGNTGPPPSEAPVRVTLPPVKTEVEPEVVAAPEVPGAEAVEPAPAADPAPVAATETPARSGGLDELLPLLLASVAIFLVVFVIGLLFF